MKVCPRCSAEKDVEHFSLDSSTADGRRVYCKSCENARMKEYNSRPGVKERSRNRHLLNLYNRTAEQIAEMFKRQDSCCAICGTTEAGTKGWQIDHDHRCCSGIKSCGECVRGILCAKCNLGLGHFPNPDTLRLAHEYCLKESK